MSLSRIWAKVVGALCLLGVSAVGLITLIIVGRLIVSYDYDVPLALVF